MTETAFRQLLEALEGATPRLRNESLGPAVRDKTSDPVLTEALVEILSEMALVRITNEDTVQSFVDSIVEALEANPKSALGDERESLRSRLTKLLNLPSVALPAKGRFLLIDHANYMHSARIFTDIRPVFGDDVHQSPATALVVHTLKMQYHQGEADTRNFFVVLDSADLDELSSVIERARAKEKSVKVLLESTGMIPLE